MARVLVLFSRRLATAIAAFALIATLILVGTERASAQSQVTGHWTGYAMGNQNGSAGVEVFTGDFANHDYANCPGDPAAAWTYGSSVSLISPTTTITTHTASGASTSNSFFYLEDSGDPACNQANYWADNYFGRFKVSTDSCSCSGSPSPGYCIDDTNGYTGNSCTDATNWGNQTYTYWSP